MPIVMIGTNLVYMATEIYMIMFVCIVKVIHNYLIFQHKNASLINPRDAFIMIYSFNYGQYHLYFLISIPIHTVPQISTGLFYLQLTYTYDPRISTGL